MSIYVSGTCLGTCSSLGSVGYLILQNWSGRWSELVKSGNKSRNWVHIYNFLITSLPKQKERKKCFIDCNKALVRIYVYEIYPNCFNEGMLYIIPNERLAIKESFVILMTKYQTRSNWNSKQTCKMYIL